MKIHGDLVQGTPEWQAFRLTHHGASEAAAMLGLSKKVTRSELLRMKHTGIPQQFSDWVQTHILDHGHHVEAQARPLVERIIGDDLYPVACSDGRLSASCDGLTLTGDTAFEHKQYATELAVAVQRGELPEEHMPQCQQIMLVTGCKRVIFTVSDGTEEGLVWMEVLPDEGWFKRIRAGWEQFDADLVEYVHEPEAPAVIAAPQEHLPALSVQVSGALAVISNLDDFGTALRAYIDRIPKKPSTDQEFADTDAACRCLKGVEDRLSAAEDSALASLSDVEQMRRTVADLRELARQTRLAAEKLVKARKEAIKTELVQKGRTAFVAHVASLQAEITAVRLNPPVPDFALAIKGLKTLSSLRDAINTRLADAKIEANELAADLRAKLKWYGENVAAEYTGLFRDLDDLVTMPAAHFQQTVSARITEHKAQQEKKLEEERERIRAEEAERAQKAVETPTQPAAPAPVSAPAPMTAGRTVVPSTAAERPTLKLGQIGERLGFTLTAEFLRSIGFEPAARERAAFLYRESQFDAICVALLNHIDKVRHQPMAEAA